MTTRWQLLIGLIMVSMQAHWLCQPAAAQAPNGFNFLKAGIRGEQGQDLALKAEHGPFLIYAISLEGEDSKMQAVRLAAELRESFGLAAYIMPKTFDFSSTVIGAGLSTKGREKRMRYADDRVVESYSILIGDYSSADLPEIKDTLRKVKSIKPVFFQRENLANSSDDVTAGEKVSALRIWMKSGKKDEQDLVEDGPMYNAFITRNPLLPKEFFQTEMDDFVTKLNKSVDHSILECKGRVTVRVAHFTGVQQMVIGGAKVEEGKPASTALEQAANKAHKLTELLRRVGYDAYEYHERSSSSVCVGSFDELGAMDANGEFIYARDILQVVETFGGTKDVQPSKYGPLPVAKTLLDVVDYKKFPELTKGTDAEKLAKVNEYSIPFEAIPKPIFVPRPATKGLYSRSLLGRN